MVRAKFKLVSVTENWYNSATGARKLRFEPVYDQSISEDVVFQKFTPSGVFEMECNNPAALAQFEIGKSYYFDMSPADVSPATE